MEISCKVLIAEDEYITRQGIRNMIDWNAEGFEIVGEACNGQDALDLAEKLKPHIVLTDIVMPIMDGLTFEKEIRARHPEIQIVVLSSYSDFDYVRDSFQSGVVDYILKPTLNPADLLKTMKQVAARIPGLTLKGRQDVSVASYVEQLLSGYTSENKQRQLRQVFQESCFILVGMAVARIYRQDTTGAERQKKLLSQYAEEHLAEFTHLHLIVEESVLLLVVNFAGSKKKEILSAVNRIVEQIALQEPLTFYAASEVFSDPAQIKDIYNGSFLANMERYFYYRGKHFVASEEFQDLKPTVKFDMAKYTKLLDTLQVKAALDFLEEYVDTVLAECSMDEMELKTLVQNSWYQLISILENHGLDADNLSYLKRDCLIKLYDCSYVQDFVRVFHVLQGDFYELISKYEIDTRSSTIQTILKYIDSHYNEPLTLASLARQFNFNYSYLSSYFRSHHKEGFSEYLNKERIRHASELLKQEDLSVSGVCEAVGYTDQSYFTRVFKKLTGITPRDYRRRYSKLGGEKK